ncbi:MAG: CCA tRNA nucleotidyltransferase [Micavibrio sp.]
MIPVKTITVQDWMSAPETVTLFDALQDRDADPQILFVGGCVRNTVLGIPAGDADLATVHPPEETMRRLEERRIRVVPTGIDHGTVTAVINGRSFEITTLRRDVETDGRHAVVAFTSDWEEDAKRRDFTMNTLLADLQGNIYDPLRRGMGDLEAGCVVFVGDPAQRIAEDYLRILRFFRFHGLYGKGAPDAAALSACRDAAEQIKTLSRERITQEFLKIIGVENAPDTLAIMFDHGVLGDLPHPDFEVDTFRALMGLQKRSETRSIAARLVCLCAGHEGHVGMIGEYLLLSKMLRRNFEALFQAVNAPMGLKERLYHFGREVGGQSVLLLAALHGAKIGDEDLAIMRDWAIPEFPLTGADLKPLGVEPGPRMGEILRDVETWWVEWEFQPDRAACLERARGVVAGT